MKKKRLMSLVLAVSMLLGSAAALPENVFSESTSITASASESLREYKNVDGGTEKNYSSKYKCTILIYGRPECGNTRSTITEASKLTSNKDINVVFVDLDANTKDKIKSFKQNMNVPGVKFCYDENDDANGHAWYYIRNYHDKSREFKSILPFVAFFNSKGDIVNASTSVLNYNYLAAYAKKCGADIDGSDLLYETIKFDVTYHQSDARDMLRKVNSFRTGKNAWAWNQDNTEKVYINGLEKLQYDYELEKAAMQRAAELVVLYSHTRPNGESCFTAYPESLSWSSKGENIAIGYTSMEAVFEAWKEENYDYSGQGHRRNMLNDGYSTIGIAHVKYNGYDYWVQEFSSNVVDTEYKAPNNKNTKVSVELKNAMTKTNELSIDKTTIKMNENAQQALPIVTRTLKLEGQWDYAPSIVISPSVKWSITSGKDIVKISGGKIISLKTGTAVVTAKSNNKTVSTKVTVSHKWTAWNTTKKATCTTDGMQRRKCSVCGKTETKSITKTGHKWSKWTAISFNFKTKTVVKSRKCSSCGKTEKQTVKGIVTRYAGANRYETATAISAKMYTSANTVIIASGMDYHDALVAVPLAKIYKAPLLLTTGTQVTRQTEAELARLKAKKVIIVSTNGAVGSNVKTALKKYNPTVISGSTYFETSVKVAQAMKKKTGKEPQTIFFATASSFADALSASPVAAIKNAPIIYLDKNEPIDYDVSSYLWNLGWTSSVKNAYVIGGDGVISDLVMEQVAKYLDLTVGKTIQRVAGVNRYETCVAVNKKFKSVLSSDGICVAKGLDFPDALAGGVYAASTKQALFLADGKKLQDCQNSYLKSKNAAKITVFGGTGAVSDELVKQIVLASI